MDALEEAWGLDVLPLDRERLRELASGEPRTAYRDDDSLRRDFQDVYDALRVTHAARGLRGAARAIVEVGSEGGRLSGLQRGPERYLGYVQLLAVMRRVLQEVPRRDRTTVVREALRLVNLRREQDLEEWDEGE